MSQEFTTTDREARGEHENGCTTRALERIRDALRGLRFGAVTVIVQDGAVVQVERTEKLRLSRGGAAP
jgi:hypothetical protein